MKVTTLICHLDGTQETAEIEVSDDWFVPASETEQEETQGAKAETENA